jgi:branched-chain amino acid aminotransferase
LDGITRRTVIGLARDKGIKVNERRIMPEELSSFEECFIVGTGAEVTPVSEIGPYNFVPGAISRALVEAYSAEVQPKALV